MKKIIMIILIIGLGFFFYLLQTGQISSYTFNIDNIFNKNRFTIKTQTEDNSIVKTSNIYANILGKEYNVFTFSSDSFTRIHSYDFPNEKYRVPLKAIDAVTGTWIGNRYVLYILEKENPNTKRKIYEIYKTEYPTDDLSKIKYYKIQSIEEPAPQDTLEVQY